MAAMWRPPRLRAGRRSDDPRRRALVARALQLPPLQPLVRGGSSSSSGSVALDADWRSSGDGCRVQAAPPAQTSLASQSRRQGKQSVSPLELQLPAKLPPEGLNPTYLAGSALRGIVVVSGAEDGRKQRSAQAAAGGASSSSNSSSCSGSVAGGGDRDGGGGGGGDGGGSGGISCAMAEGADGKIQSEMEASSLCETLAERLGAAHVALPRLLRGQLEALQQMRARSQLGPSRAASSPIRCARASSSPRARRSVPYRRRCTPPPRDSYSSSTPAWIRPSRRSARAFGPAWSCSCGQRLKRTARRQVAAGRRLVMMPTHARPTSAARSRSRSVPTRRRCG